MCDNMIFYFVHVPYTLYTGKKTDVFKIKKEVYCVSKKFKRGY